MPSPRINDFRVRGNLTEDPKQIHTNGGRDLTVFRLAENRRVMDQQTQQWVDAPPVYYDVAVSADEARLGNLAANVMASVSKGDRVVVEGSLTSTPYQSENGQLGMNHRIWAEEVSPSLQFATAEPVKNTRPQAGAQTEDAVQWEAVTPGTETAASMA